MLPSWCKDSVTVLRAPRRGAGTRGERDWDGAVAHVLDGCSLQPSGTSSAFGTVDAVSTADAMLYAPPDADIAEGDRVVFGGATYVVDGIPYAWASPTGRVSSKQARLLKWAG
jgi:hypothetical protein